MVASRGGYFGNTFQGQCGVTQGDLISPTIFNVAVDVVLQNWVSMVVEVDVEACPEIF